MRKREHRRRVLAVHVEHQFRFLPAVSWRLGESINAPAVHWLVAVASCKLTWPRVRNLISLPTPSRCSQTVGKVGKSASCKVNGVEKRFPYGVQLIIRNSCRMLIQLVVRYKTASVKSLSVPHPRANIFAELCQQGKDGRTHREAQSICLFEKM